MESEAVFFNFSLWFRYKIVLLMKVLCIAVKNTFFSSFPMIFVRRAPREEMDLVTRLQENSKFFCLGPFSLTFYFGLLTVCSTG